VIPAFGADRSGQPAGPPVQAARLVLVLDEALPVRRGLQEILGKLGVPESDVAMAETPEEALALFRKETPRLVFTEFIGVHPDEGLDMIHAMLEMAPACKIVLLTSEPRDAPEVRAAIRAGVFAHLEKPLRHDKIRQLMTELESEEGGIERFR
jgi:DNA-binding NtrC family response regulator